VTITNSKPPDPPLTITSYTLVNADTGQDLFDLTEGQVLDLSKLPARLGVRANPAPTNVASIKFGYDETPGKFNAQYKIESLLPYALFADSANGTKYNPGIFNIGSHTLVGTPYAGASATGIVGTSNTLHFSVIKSPPPTQGSVVFTLVNADTGADIQTLNPGATLNLANLPAHLSVRANPTVGNVGSVRFGYDANSNFRTDSSAPFSMNGDNGSGSVYTPVDFTNGSHTLTGTLFTGSSGGGSNIGSSSVQFTVTNGVTPPDSGAVTLTLVNADTGADIMPITEGMTLDLTTLPANLSVRGNPTIAGTKSMKFGYDLTTGSFNANFHVESTAPYSLNGDTTTKYTPVKFNAGNHTLTATIYNNTGATGTTLGSSTVHFTVGGTVQPPPGNGVTNITLLNATADTVIGTLTEGQSIPLASLPATISFRAETQGTIGSVKFGYDQVAGNFNANYHTEGLAPYTLLGENNNGKDFIGVAPTKGAHTITLTAYTGGGAGGSVINTKTIHFTIT